MTSTVHETFTIERTFDASPARVWAAFAVPEKKKRWFGGANEGYTTTAENFDFRVGGTETSEGKWADGTTSVYAASYWDIVDNERMVYSYWMEINGKRISVSVSTIELVPSGSGTRLTMTEQGVYLDGLDQAAQRQEGTEWLLDELGRSLD